MHALWPPRRAHVHGVVLDEEVLSLDQFDAHLLGEERVLVVRRVVRPRGQHRDGGHLLAGRRDGAQVLEQQVRIVLDRADRLGGEELGKEPHHHLAVLEHVRHARGNAQVVLENVVLALARPDDVDAGDVRVDAARHVHADHLAPELRIAEDALARQTPGFEDGLVVVDVVQEQVQRVHALREATLEELPVLGGDDPRDDVERDQALGAVAVAVDGEGDAHAVKGALGLVALLRDARRRGPVEPAGKGQVMAPRRPVGGQHFVVRGARQRDHSGMNAGLCTCTMQGPRQPRNA